MRILAFESSAVSASVCLLEDNKVIAQTFQNCGLTHSRTLLPMAEQLLSLSSTAFTTLDALAVACGPGSFTGIRIGVATVKGMAMAHDLPCIGISTLEAMAYGLQGLQGQACCVMDARANQVYHAQFALMDSMPQRLSPDRAITLDALAQEIGDSTQILVGDGANLCYTNLKERCPAIYLAPPQLRYATGYGVAAAAHARLSAGEGVDAEHLAESYLRAPQAVRERAARLQSQQKNILVEGS